jgi:hypothetical protein
MVAPVWTDPFPITSSGLPHLWTRWRPPRMTTYTISASAEARKRSLDRKERVCTDNYTDYDSDSVLLLFLRSLRSIRVSIDDLSGKAQSLNTINREDYHGYGGEMIEIGNTWTTNRTHRTGVEQSDEYLVVRHSANNMPEEAIREGRFSRF